MIYGNFPKMPNMPASKEAPGELIKINRKELNDNEYYISHNETNVKPRTSTAKAIGDREADERGEDHRAATQKANTDADVRRGRF